MSTKPTEPKPITLTIVVLPIKNGKRSIVVSGAPEGEMPIVETGVFADLHRLIDQVWLTLLQRKPQVVTIKTDKKAKGPMTHTPDEGAGGNSDEESQDEPSTSADPGGECDQLVTSEPAPEPPAELPVIETPQQAALFTEEA